MPPLLFNTPLAVVPVLVGPLQVLLALLPAIALSLMGILISLFRPRTVWTLCKLLWHFKLHLIGLTAVVSGAWWSIERFWPVPVAVDQTAEAGRDWPLFRGDLARTGAAPGGEDPRDGGRNWACTDAPGSVFSSPAVVGNRVYYTSALPGVGDGRGRIVCVDADSGERIWEGGPDGYAATFSSPVVSGNHLVCGEGLHTTRQARIVCLSLKPGQMGRVLWTHRTHSHVECTPVVSDGRIYIGAGDDGYYCLALEPQTPGTAQVLWHLDGDKYLDAETALTVHDGIMYAGLGVGGMALCVIDAVTGKELQRIATGLPIFSPPAIADDALYVGMGNGDYVNTAEKMKVPQPPRGAVWCLELADRAIRWQTELPRTILGSVAVKGAYCYAACRDGVLYQLDRVDGRIVTSFDCRSPLIASPAVGVETVYTVTHTGTLFALDTNGLKPVWKYQLGSGGNSFSSPAVARGHLYVGTDADGLVCAGRPGVPQVPVWSGGSGAADDSPLQFDGACQWRLPLVPTGMISTTTPAVIGEHLLVPVVDASRCGLADLSPDGKTDDQRERWFVSTALPITQPPVAIGNAQGDLSRVMVVTGHVGDADRQLQAIDGTGAVLWQRPIAAEASGRLRLTRNALLVQDTADGLSHLDLNGSILTTIDCGPLLQPPVDHRGLLVLCGGTATAPLLLLADAESGAVLWRHVLPGVPVTAPIPCDTTIIVATTVGVSRRSLLDGSALWQQEGGAVGNPLVAGHQVWWAEVDGTIQVADLESGAILASTTCDLGEDLTAITRADHRQTVPAMDAGGMLLVGRQVVAAYRGIVMTLAYDIEQSHIIRTTWSPDYDWGPFAAPPVAIGGKLFTPRVGTGLVCLGVAP